MVEVVENTSVDVEDGCAIAYVDGSYNVKDRRFAYGIVMFCKNEELLMNRAFSHDELSEMRNVAGEIMGAAQAMKIARKMQLKKLTIFHDYEGIANWCTGLWKAKKPWTKKYRAFYLEISKEVQIEFVKVQGHSGEKYNDLADRLAKDALGLK